MDAWNQYETTNSDNSISEIGEFPNTKHTNIIYFFIFFIIWKQQQIGKYSRWSHGIWIISR